MPQKKSHTTDIENALKYKRSISHRNSRYTPWDDGHY